MHNSVRVRLTRAQRRRVVRTAVYEKHGKMCFFCGLREGTTLDHVIPESQGGKFDEDNLVPACEVCNQAKGSSSLDEYRTKLWALTPHGDSCLKLEAALASATCGDLCLLNQLEVAACRQIAGRLKESFPVPRFAGEMKRLDPVRELLCQAVA